MLLKSVPGSSVIEVPTHKVKSKEELDDLYEFWRDQGYEGQIIRQDATYQTKRTQTMLKRKEFVTEMLSAADPEQKGREAKVIDVLDQQGEKLARLAHDQPQVAASLFTTLGLTYRALGQMVDGQR